MNPQRSKEITAKILKVLSTRAVGKTMCPSEALPPSQRQSQSRMSEVRQIAARMAASGRIEIIQRGRIADSGPWVGPIRLRLPKSAVPFEYQGIDFRKHPDRYRVARGEQGVLSVEPYKSELLPLWRFKTAAIAVKSSSALLKRFEEYRKQDDFVGMDMARKFVQMGYTRARRYANHRSGRKYEGAVPKHMKGRSGAHGRKIAPADPDPEKALAAQVFKKAWDKIEAIDEYRLLRKEWKERLG